MIDRDQKIKIHAQTGGNIEKISPCRAEIDARALSVKKKSATPWMMLARVSSILTTAESSSRRLSLGGITLRLVIAG
jgi:hypothetical protein